MGKEKELSVQEKLFAHEYLIDLDAKAAALRTKCYSYNVASKKAASWLAEGGKLYKPHLAKYINEKLNKKFGKLDLNADNVLGVLQKLVFFDPRKLYNDDGSLKSIVDLDDDTIVALAGVEVFEEKQKDTVLGYTKKIKFSDRKPAVDTAMKYLGLLKDKTEVEHKGGISLEINYKPQNE